MGGTDAALTPAAQSQSRVPAGNRGRLLDYLHGRVKGPLHEFCKQPQWPA